MEKDFCVDCFRLLSEVHNLLVGESPKVYHGYKVTFLKAGVEGFSQNRLTEALELLGQSFQLKSIIDFFGFERDILASVVYNNGSEVSPLNHFRGFYTVILEDKDKVVSVATIRIFGKRVAEIPFIATRKECRGQGCCQILFEAIEKELKELGVTCIIVSSPSNVSEMWVKFGFITADGSEFSNFTFLRLEDTIMYLKPIC